MGVAVGVGVAVDPSIGRSLCAFEEAARTKKANETSNSDIECPSGRTLAAESSDFIWSQNRKRNSDKRFSVARQCRSGSAGRTPFCPLRLAISRDRRGENLGQIYPDRGQRRQNRSNPKTKECSP